MWAEFSFENIHWGVIFLQLPTILSLTAFTLLLVPIRIPTLSMITGDPPHPIALIPPRR
jgi:MFS superfamily sulfate permease-like transporter